MVVAGVIVLLIATLGDHESSYRGKSVYVWAQRITSPDAGVSNEAYLVFTQQIMPALCTTMFNDTNDSKLRVTLVDALNSLPSVVIRLTPAEGRRAQSALDLGNFGPAARPAIPQLLRAAKGPDPAVRPAALLALGQIHCEAETIIPVLIKFLDNDELNASAAEALGNFGELAKPAIPKLVPMLKARDKDAVKAATEAIKKIDPQAVPGLGTRGGSIVPSRALER